MGLIAFSVVWIGYGFEYDTILLQKDNHPTATKLFAKFFPETTTTFLINLCERIPIPFPSFFAGLAVIKVYKSSLPNTFLAGKHFYGSPWYGYIISFLILF